MESTTLLLFAAPVLPLPAPPGPDLVFLAPPSRGAGAPAGPRATAGVCAGYVVHSALVALGLAAIIAASPPLFEALRWIGVGYLVYLALRLLRSAMKAGSADRTDGARGAPFWRGFLTAVLNPKGMLIYFAILPQFMHAQASAAAQAIVLSALFIALCALVYAGLSLVLGSSAGRRRSYSDRRRRWVEGACGGLIGVAAGALASG